jgi:hypothetical protein
MLFNQKLSAEGSPLRLMPKADEPLNSIILSTTLMKAYRKSQVFKSADQKKLIENRQNYALGFVEIHKKMTPLIPKLQILLLGQIVFIKSLNQISQKPTPKAWVRDYLKTMDPVFIHFSDKLTKENAWDTLDWVQLKKIFTQVLFMQNKLEKTNKNLKQALGFSSDTENALMILMGHTLKLRKRLI